MSGETGWRAVAEADGWGDIDVHRVRAQAAESIAWALLDETMDTADREPSEEAYKAALATADRMLGLAARQESLAERVKALADEWERHHATCDDCTGDYLSAARELRRALLDPSETGGGRRDG